MSAVVNNYHDHPKDRRARRISLIARLGIPLAMLASISLGALHADAASQPTTLGWLFPNSSTPMTACQPWMAQVQIIGGLPSSGTVTFSDETGTLATAPVLLNTATTAITPLSAGLHSLNAHYSGDSAHTPSNAQTLVRSVAKCNALPVLMPVFNPNGTITLMINLMGQGKLAPTGTVQLLDYGEDLGQPVHLAPSTTSAAASAVIQVQRTTGQHLLSVQFSGDAVYNGVRFGGIPYSGTGAK
jgi:hypothetical protein